MENNSPSFRSLIDLCKEAVEGDGYPFPYAKLVGFRLTAVEPGKATVEMELGEQHRNMIGTVHGGVYASVADTATGIAHASLLGKDELSTTVDLAVHFLRPAQGGKLKSEAKVVRHGRTLTLVECEIWDGMGRHVAKAVATYMTLGTDGRPK